MSTSIRRKTSSSKPSLGTNRKTKNTHSLEKGHGGGMLGLDWFTRSRNPYEPSWYEKMFGSRNNCPCPPPQVTMPPPTQQVSPMAQSPGMMPLSGMRNSFGGGKRKTRKHHKKSNKKCHKKNKHNKSKKH